MHAAAALLLAIQCLQHEYLQSDLEIRRKTDFALVKAAAPRRGTMSRKTVAGLTIYSEAYVAEEMRLLRLYVQHSGEWWQLRERGEEPQIEDRRRGETALPIEVRPEGGLAAVTYTGRWIGANQAGERAKTLLFDVSAGKPRIRLLVECEQFGGGGACGAPTNLREPHTQLTCDGNLRCTSTQTQWIDWTTRTATRTFDLLTDQTYPPKRFAAKTYASGTAFAAAFAEDRGVLAGRAVIARIGPVTPVFELSRDSILFAGPDKDARAAVRFFHLQPGSWREIALTRLTDAGYLDAGAPSALGKDHTPDAPQLLFFAWNIEYNGKGRLIEVLAREGEARSLYWIMFDPNGRTGAIRLATDTPEFRHCDDRLYPPSFTSVGIPDRGLPAQVTATRSWRMRDFEDKTLASHCGLAGHLGWSSSKGWQPALFEAPCSKPWPQPYVPVLDDDGTLGVDFAPARDECACSP